MTAPDPQVSRHRILLVEDEPSLARTLSDMLRASNYHVDTDDDGANALETAGTGGFDLVLLDVMLPSMDGFEVAAALRGRGVDTPILMLTARDELSDKVLGLKSGADDYLTKPFEAEELLARIEALLRRANREPESQIHCYEFPGFRVDFDRRTVAKGKETFDLSDQESRLLRYLIENKGQVISRDTMLKEVWGYDTVPITRTVDVHIAWLRQKIEPDAKTPRMIVTVHGRGYRFEG